MDCKQNLVYGDFTVANEFAKHCAICNTNWKILTYSKNK